MHSLCYLSALSILQREKTECEHCSAVQYCNTVRTVKSLHFLHHGAKKDKHLKMVEQFESLCSDIFVTKSNGIFLKNVKFNRPGGIAHSIAE